MDDLFYYMQMAKELAPQDLLDLSPDEPWRYNLQIQMYPMWRTYLLEEPENRRFKIIEDSKYDNFELRARFMARIAGVSEASIDSLYVSDDIHPVVSILPSVTPQEMGEFFAEKLASQTTPKLKLVK